MDASQTEGQITGNSLQNNIEILISLETNYAGRLLVIGDLSILAQQTT